MTFIRLFFLNFILFDFCNIWEASKGMFCSCRSAEQPVGGSADLCKMLQKKTPMYTQNALWIFFRKTACNRMMQRDP